MKYRTPRKLKKKIPKDTFYCYDIKPCKFYTYVDGLEGYCSLIKCEITDQVKECGERYGKYE